jgi:hypothetical protein
MSLIFYSATLSLHRSVALAAQERAAGMSAGKRHKNKHRRHRGGYLSRPWVWAALATISAALIGTAGGVILELHNYTPPVIVPLASGTSYTYSPSDESPIYSCANVSCSLTGAVENYVKVAMVCWTDAEPFNGLYKSKRWFEVVADADSNLVEGYMHSSYVQKQTKVGECRGDGQSG